MKTTDLQLIYGDSLDVMHGMHADARLLKDWVDTIRAKVNAASSLEALRDDLLASYGELDSQELTKVMALAFACSDLSGRFDVKEGG